MDPTTKGRFEIAGKIEHIFRQTEGVVDVDSYVETQSAGYRFVIDQQKTSQLAVVPRDITETLNSALTPRTAGLFHRSDETEDVDLVDRIAPRKTLLH